MYCLTFSGFTIIWTDAWAFLIKVTLIQSSLGHYRLRSHTVTNLVVNLFCVLEQFTDQVNVAMANSHYLALQYNNFMKASLLAVATHGTPLIHHSSWSIFSTTLSNLVWSQLAKGKLQPHRGKTQGQIFTFFTYGPLSIAIYAEMRVFGLFEDSSVRRKLPCMHSVVIHSRLMKACRPNPTGNLVTVRRDGSSITAALSRSVSSVSLFSVSTWK